MSEFFHGWRRKVGCAALVMALVLMAMWLRSYLFSDEVLIPYGKSTHFPMSVRGRIGWGRQTPSNPSDRLVWHAFNLSRMNVIDSQQSCNLQICWRWDGFRYEFGTLKYQPSPIQIEMWTVPYWSLTLPLAILSGYLVWWRPKPKGPLQA